ncbi:hypothetical protein GGX14DRAFT_693037 [Mycena pura]|uniref:Transmembrane protein n=1 Tax=Mycena pura TaxID=153505 RepID=A0AAD7E492_9AGAR|nr:hypothetical protein GGX14DRAFT_693037 [Mycena pura]
MIKRLQFWIKGLAKVGGTSSTVAQFSIPPGHHISILTITMSSSHSNGRHFAETQREVVDNQLRFREQISTPLNETTNDHLAWPVSRLGSFVTSWTHNAALQTAVSDSDIDEAVESMKAEWTSVGRWLFALAAMNMSLFTIDSQSLFEVDEFAQKAIAASTVATGLGILCDAWFLVRFLHLRRWDFINRARGIYGSDLLFCLSAKLPSLTALVSLGSLMAFGGHIACNVLPPVLVVMMGLVLLALVMGVGYLVNGVTVLGSFISGGASAMGCLLKVWSVEDRETDSEAA